MSQEKVNQYKENKKNRKEIAKKAKQKSMITKICVDSHFKKRYTGIKI